VQERTDDLAEVHAMLAAGEIDIARDELLWLLEGCRDFIDAHKLLAELAVAEEDIPLARAHFGFAYQIGCDALPAAGLDGPLAYNLQANQPFLESAKGLAWCLVQLQKGSQARAILEQLLRLDESDPLGARAMLAELPALKSDT
jgi:Tfp pilus assembly protein PilF